MTPNNKDLVTRSQPIPQAPTAAFKPFGYNDN